MLKVLRVWFHAQALDIRQAPDWPIGHRTEGRLQGERQTHGYRQRGDIVNEDKSIGAVGVAARMRALTRSTSSENS